MFFFYFLDEGGKLPRALKQVRDNYPNMTVGMLETFIRIASPTKRLSTQTMSMRELADEMEMPYPTLAAHIAKLGEGTSRSPGLKLLERHSVDGVRRPQVMGTSKEGSALYHNVVSEIFDAEARPKAKHSPK